MHSIKDKVCVVTGAAKSIGFGVAERYCALGAKVALIDINPAVVESAKTLQEKGYQAKAFVLDITDPEAVKDVFAQIRAEFGPIYALANVAGIVSQHPIEEVTLQEWEKIMRVNVYGAFFCIQQALPDMKENREGKIINFSSKSGKTGSALMVPYSSAKGAVISMTQAIAYEVAPFNINCNCLCPGITDMTGVWDAVSAGYIKNLQMPRDQVIDKFTAKIPLKRLTSIDDVVDFVEFLTVSGNYCTGQAFNISGGREMH